MRDSILRETEPELILLFGSQARGDADEGSDVDVLIVAAQGHWRKPSRMAELGRVYAALPRGGRGLDVLLFTPEEFDFWRNTTNHVAARAAREGRVLYERP